MKKFYRSSDERQMAGVCGGLGEYFDIDPELTRFAVVAAAMITAFIPALLLYIAAWIVFPSR